MAFSDIQAQDRAVGILRAALAAERVAHAYLFSGPEGVGKTLAARTLAAALVCERVAGDPCDACRPCRKVADGVHPDVSLVEPEGAGRLVKIDRVREVSRSFRFPPFEGRHRVVIFTAADRLRAEAANALLKTLEEPPDRTVLVLVSSAPQALLDTIRSRCQQVRFAPLPRELCADIVEGEGVPASDASVAAALAEGSAGRALELVRSGLLDERRATLQAVVELSLSRPGKLLALAAEWSAGADAASSREALRGRLDLLASWYRDLLVAGAGVAGEQLVHSDLGEQIRGSALGRTAALRSLSHLRQARAALDLNAGARLTCERLLVGLAAEAR